MIRALSILSAFLLLLVTCLIPPLIIITGPLLLFDFFIIWICNSDRAAKHERRMLRLQRDQFDELASMSGSAVGVARPVRRKSSSGLLTAFAWVFVIGVFVFLYYATKGVF